MRKSGSQKISFGLAVGLHIVLILLLIISFEHTIYLPAMNQPDENKEVIDAVVVNKKSLQDEIDRLIALGRDLEPHESPRYHVDVLYHEEAALRWRVHQGRFDEPQQSEQQNRPIARRRRRRLR